jgi:hypothetical protein
VISEFMKNILMLIVLLGQLDFILAQSVKTRFGQLDFFSGYYAQGLGDMSDLSYFGFTGSLDLAIKQTPLSFNATLYGGRFNMHRAENLPMSTFDDGFSEEVKIRSGGGVLNGALALRYTPKNAELKEIYPYAEIGLGYSRYRQIWRSCGPKVCGHANYPDDCPEYVNSHQERGSAHSSGTFFGLAEIGFMVSYPYSENDPERFYFGLSLRYEVGGLVNYVNPKKYENHFYYESGLGAERNRPFTGSEAESKHFFLTAKHQQLHIKLILFRMIF